MKQTKKCDKKCPNYTSGMCFKEPKDVKIVKVGEPCKWECKESE